MCLVCILWNKGLLTKAEANNALSELSTTYAHALEVTEKLDEYSDEDTKDENI